MLKYKDTIKMSLNLMVFIQVTIWFKKKEWGIYITCAEEYDEIDNDCIATYVKDWKVTHFDGFGVEKIPNKTRKFTGNKNIILDIFRIHVYNS